jgi:hypothetical protein
LNSSPRQAWTGLKREHLKKDCLFFRLNETIPGLIDHIGVAFNFEV